jgi:acetyltransferase-like isoleucine patch superfamily enzyme
MKAIISPHCRIRHPEHFVIGADSIVDDYCYFSTRVRVGRCSHIATGVSIAGGVAHQFELGDMSSLSAGVRVWCTSDDFANDLVCIIPADIASMKEHLISGDVHLGHYTAVGSNSVIMPRNSIPEGTVIGALSLVPPGFDFEPWSVYAGVPVRRLRERNRDAVMRQAEALARALDARGEG